MTKAFDGELAIFRAIADYTYDWESWIDPRGRTAWVNPAAERMTGYTVDDCVRMKSYPLALVHPKDRARMRAAMAGARKGSSGNDVEFRVVRKDGEVRWLAMSWQPIVFRGQPRGYRTSVRDIHDRKLAEEALVEAKRRAEEADRAKSEFLAVMSHEVRSPMQAVSGYAQLLATSSLTPKQRAHLDVIIRENAALLRIVGDVLDFSALQAGRVALERTAFGFERLVANVIDVVRPIAAERSLRLNVSIAKNIPPLVVGDPHRVRQALLNIVGNALKFTSRGSVSIEVSIRRRATQEARIVTRVRDTGIGIAKAKLGSLFEMFSQVDSSSSRLHGGSGLGLAITKRLAERMGGSISVESARNKGSVFTLELPFEVASHPPRPMPRKSAPPDHTLAERHPLRILVVDDSAVARDVTCELLRALGYAPARAASGRRALALLQHTPFDLVLLDMHMPGLDGVRTARAIRALHIVPSPMLVALTADVFVNRTPDTALDGVLTKPVTLSSLAAFLSAATPVRARPLEASVIADLRATRGKNGSLLDMLRPRFRAEGAKLVKELEVAQRQGDRARVAELAHRLKGLALTVGARNLAVRAAALEAVSSASDVRNTRKTFELAVAALERA